MASETTQQEHDDTHSHGEPGHVHDEACAEAHGLLTPEQPTARLVLVFDSPVARECAALAQRLGWSVSLVDPAAATHLEVGLDLLAGIPSASLDVDCDVVVCDHERPELGDLLAEVLTYQTRWVGVMGSRRHTAPHVEALQQRGLDEATIARVHRPIGLDIGSRTPPEIAIATVAGLIADRNGRDGGEF